MKQIFPIVPASNGPFWVLGGVSVLLIGLVILLAYMAHSSRNAKFEVSSTGLRIKEILYGRTIPVRSLIAESLKKCKENSIR